MRIFQFTVWIIFLCAGPVAASVSEPPLPPAQGAFYTNEYRNMLKEAGIEESRINQKLETLWTHFFYGDATNQALFYPVGTDEAYILDTGNSDVRSEGMSYGMMICVQMDKQTEFNRLWKWAKTHMQHQDGQYKGYFAWQMNTNGTVRGETPASDGEEYFVMALMFASNRWGDGEGIYNYKKEANDILSACQDRTVQSGGVSKLFDETEKQVVFCPIGSAAWFTDPSYHLPAFYHLWSRWATDKSKRAFWAEVAAKSREMWAKFAHPITGLMPDYAEFSGEAHTGDGDHSGFYYDAWRCIMNMAMDYAWFNSDDNPADFNTEQFLINKQHNFFESKGIHSYGSLYKLDGTVYQNNADHSPGLVACNAAGALASNQFVAWEFINDFFNTAIPSGQYRYYNGMLYFMNYLHLSGNFKIYKPENEDDDDDPNPVDGYFTIEDFNQRTIGETCTMYKKNGASQGTATVSYSPTDNTEQSAQVITANWDEFIRFEVRLPQGKTISGYESLDFDIYYNSTASGSDNSYKDFYVYADNKEIYKDATGDKNGSGHNVWLHKTVDVKNVTAGNNFTLDLGVRSNKANYYVDNVQLKEIPSPVTLVEQIKTVTHPYVHSMNVLSLINGKTGDIAVYDMRGNLKLSGFDTSWLNISPLASGIYAVKIQQKGEVYVGKIVK